MREMLPTYIELSRQLLLEEKDTGFIMEHLKNEGASLAATVISLYKVGVSIEEIDEILANSSLWEDEPVDLTELFFDFVTLDEELEK